MHHDFRAALDIYLGNLSIYNPVRHPSDSVRLQESTRKYVAPKI